MNVSANTQQESSPAVTSHMLLDDMLRLGEIMLQTAENEQWERLVELQANRQELLASYFRGADASQESRRQTISRLLVHNQSLIEALVAKRTRLAEEFKEKSVGHQALQAYQQCGE